MLSRLDARPLRGGEGREADLGEPGPAQVRRRANEQPSATSPAPVTACSGASAAMADAEVAIALALADGRARLTIETRDLGAAVVEQVVGRLARTSPSCPTTGAPNGLRSRRGRLLAANLLVDGSASTSGWPRRRSPPTGCRASRVTLEKGRVMVPGRSAPPAATRTSRRRARAGRGRRARAPRRHRRRPRSGRAPAAVVRDRHRRAATSAASCRATTWSPTALPLDIDVAAARARRAPGGGRLAAARQLDLRLSSAVVSSGGWS